MSAAIALSMEARIRQLQVRHRVHLPEPPPLPLAEPVDYPIIAEGLASTFDFDMARCQIKPFALSRSRDPLPPLLYRHDPQKIAGHIEALEFDDRGRLRIKPMSTTRTPNAPRRFRLVLRYWTMRSATRTARPDLKAL